MQLDTAPRIVTTADGREVGYRRFGAGPPVGLLHASPRSAVALLRLGAALAGRFTVYAFDTPGFGWSAPLALPRPDATDFAAALMATCDALGIGRLALYGSHTGAAIAVAAALGWPERVTALALDGYALFQPAEAAACLGGYLAPFRPHWDGSHLAWLWSRVKDQFTVFPWDLRADCARLDRPLASLAVRQAGVVDFLAAGDAYRAAYAAAFRFPGAAALARVAVPTTVMARQDDLLFSHLDALPPLPAHIGVRRLGVDNAAWADAIAAALAAGDAGEGGSAAPADLVARVPGGVIGLRRWGSGKRRLVLLPPIPGSARALAPLGRAFDAEWTVIAADLPGFGASALADAATPAAMAQAIGAALPAPPDLVAAIGESGAVGGALATASGCPLVLVDPLPDAARDGVLQHFADVAPCEHGGHLLAAWHQLRDAGLWRPWHTRTPSHAIDAGSEADLGAMQAVLTDWLRGGTAGRATLAAVLAEPLRPPPGTHLLTRPGHPWAALLTPLGLPTAVLPDDPRDLAAAILAGAILAETGR